MGNNRKVHLDVLRIIAIFLVLFTHTNTKGYALFTISRSSSFFWLYLFISIFVKMAVPLFFMISGALLLGKNEPIKTIIIHRFLKFGVTLLVFSLIMYMYFNNFNLSHIKLVDFIKLTWSGKINVAYWYLYAYLAFILMLPFLRKLAQNMNNKEFKFLFSIYTLIQFFKILQYIVSNGQVKYNPNFSLFFETSNIFYPLLGYFLENRLNINNIKKSWLIEIGVFSFLSIAVSCIMTYYHCSLIGEWKESTSQMFFKTLTYIPATAMFLYIKLVFAKYHLKDSIKNLITVIGSTTFGIYLLDTIYRETTINIYYIMLPYVHSLLACIIWLLFACILGSLITYLLKKLPLLKKII